MMNYGPPRCGESFDIIDNELELAPKRTVPSLGRRHYLFNV